MKLKIGEENVIARGCTAEEDPWGAWQFPRPYNIDGRLIVSVHVDADGICTYGTPLKWYESFDEGKTWSEFSNQRSAECGLKLPSGDKIYFPMESGIALSDYKLESWNMRTPDYDFDKKAEEGTLPIPDGITEFIDGTIINAYRAERMPGDLSKKEWHMKRIKNGETETIDEVVPVEWPYLTRVVYTKTHDNVLKSIFPRGNMKIAPDGSVWVSAFSGEGHINPDNGQYSPYYSAELFASYDNAKSFKQIAHMEYPADGNEYSYQSGGFSDSDFEFMDDGSIVWFFRTAWAGFTGREWDPMYMSRSTDMGKTWSKPEKFADTGILPRLCKLNCGAVLLCYARPGMFVTGCDDGKGINWIEPVTVMTDGDRSSLANIKIDNPTFHDWDGSCNNPEIIPLDDNSALLFYSDFYYPDEDGVKRKTILCRKITVEG